MKDKARAIDGILQIMNSCWDTPPDCNGGESIAYAEALFDMIIAGKSKETIHSYLAGIQADKFDMSP